MALIRVRYKGIADERTITKKDFASTGLEVSQDLKWNHANGFQVIVESTDRLEEVLRDQGHFTITHVDDAGNEVVVAQATDTQDEGDVLVDGSTGDSTPNKQGKRS